MISMLSQLSSTQDKATPFQYERPSPRPAKSGVWVKLVMAGVSVLVALYFVNGVHGIAQAFGIA